MLHLSLDTPKIKLDKKKLKTNMIHFAHFRGRYDFLTKFICPNFFSRLIYLMYKLLFNPMIHHIYCV